jgi:hypothetical protein
MSWLDGNGTFLLQVVGESHYRANLVKVCDPDEDGTDCELGADLVLDDANPYDRNAVQVQIQGLQVGFLDRENARAFRQRVRAEGRSGLRFPCKARVKGGWDRGGGDQGNFGVTLDVLLYD